MDCPTVFTLESDSRVSVSRRRPGVPGSRTFLLGCVWVVLWTALWLGVAFPRTADAQAAFVVLRPTHDTFIARFAQTSNYGRWWFLYQNGSRTLTSRMLLQFDVSSVPPGAQITSASLGVWHWLGDRRRDRIDVYAVSRPWVEGTGGFGSGATWLTRDGSAPWASPGGDFNSTSIAQARPPRGLGWARWDVTPLVQRWVNGTVPNHGVLLKRSNENPRSGRFHYFMSDESFVPPRLFITYTLPGQPDITIVKAALTSSDPVNGSTNPKAIPGASVVYSLRAINEGRGATDANTVVITDPLPPDAALVVTDWSGSGSGPVAFRDGSPSSGLSFNFVSLGSGSDDLEFSADGGGTYSYVPVPDAQGVDPRVTHLRVRPRGTLAASGGAPHPGFELRFQVRVR